MRSDVAEKSAALKRALDANDVNAMRSAMATLQAAMMAAGQAAYGGGNGHGSCEQNPLGILVRGKLAGAAGTVAMDLLWFYRYKRSGGRSRLLDWEFSVGLDDWSNAPAPAQLGKRLFEAFFQRELNPRWAALTNNVMHWAYGMGWGAVYGLVAATVCPPKIRSGLVFGTLVWTADYVVLPLANVYKPMWEYDLPTLANDLSAHLVYGVATAMSFRAP